MNSKNKQAGMRLRDMEKRVQYYLNLKWIWQWEWSRSVVSDSLQPHGLQPTGLLHPGDSPGKNTGVGCHFLLQGILLTQGSNPGLLHCRQTLHHLSRQGSPVNEYERFLKVVHSWVIPKVSTENSNQSFNCYREQEMGLNMRVQLWI